MSRWAATSTTRWRGPAGVSRTPSGWKSRTALSSGIGTWSWAWKRTAAASSLRSVTGGSSSVRSTVRWLATPTRTRLLSPLSLEELAQGLAERALVDHFALAHDVGGQRHGGRVLGHDRAVDVRLHGGDVAGLDVQADDVPAGAASEVTLSEGMLSLSLGREGMSMAVRRSGCRQGSYRRGGSSALVQKVLV